MCGVCGGCGVYLKSPHLVVIWQRILCISNYTRLGEQGITLEHSNQLLLFDHFRKEKRNPKITLADGSDIFNCLKFSEDFSESERLSKDSKKFLKKTIENLPEKQKQVLIMRHYMDMSFQEIAEATNVSINTALGRMRYALIALRKKIKPKQIAYD